MNPPLQSHNHTNFLLLKTLTQPVQVRLAAGGDRHGDDFGNFVGMICTERAFKAGKKTAFRLD